ncbi:hypothetical protein GCK72_022897, partial [Caenorhabditis remanei]
VAGMAQLGTPPATNRRVRGSIPPDPQMAEITGDRKTICSIRFEEAPEACASTVAMPGAHRCRRGQWLRSTRKQRRIRRAPACAGTLDTQSKRKKMIETQLIKNKNYKR